MPGLLIIAHAPLASSLKAVAEHTFPDCGGGIAALDVTPQIDESGNIILHIHPSVSLVSTVTKSVNTGVGGTLSLPLASSSISETDSIVRARDGQIVAIGGLMRQATFDDQSGLPGLPKTGFGQTSKRTEKRELVILLKPMVVAMLRRLRIAHRLAPLPRWATTMRPSCEIEPPMALPDCMTRLTIFASSITWRSTLEALEEGARNTLAVAVACACAGLIIGVDTVVVCGKQVLGKPRSKAEAIALLKAHAERGVVPRPTIVHDKQGVDDPHDNRSLGRAARGRRAIRDDRGRWRGVCGRDQARCRRSANSPNTSRKIRRMSLSCG